jgi:PAS domain S-box-containing protein
MAKEEGDREIEALRRSERLLRATFEQAAVGMAHVGLDGTWLNVNQRLCEILGYERDELINRMSFQDVTYPDDLAPDLRQYKRLLGGEIDRYTLDKRYVRKDGSVVWVSLMAALVRDADGQPDFFIGVVQDITGRKHVEEALRQSEQHYRIMGEALPYGVWMCDAQGRAEYMSPSFLDLLEMTLDEAREFGWSARLPPDERESTLRKWLHCVETGEHWNDEHRILGPDGRYHAVLTRGRPVRNAKDEIVKWVGINLDIDDRKRMESQLKLSRERLRLALDAADLGTWDWDLETGSVTWGGYAVELFGPPPDSFDEAYHLIAERVHPADREALERVASDITGQEDDFSLELRLLGPADEVQWIELRGRVYHRGDGQPIRVSGIVQDVTERQRLREQRAELLHREQEARREAEEASEIKSRFLAMVSHELRTPLTSIMGFSSTLLAPDVVWDAESQHDFISTIQEEAEKLKDLVEQLLEVSRLQSGRLRMERSRITLDEALAIADAQLQILVDQHVLDVDFADDLPPVDADARRIAQVIVNLVSNAVKYSPPGSRITLRARRGSDGTVRVDVSDEGPGIPPEARELVFEAFRQIERGGSQGAGLGLAICKGLIEAHGGHIWVVDDPPPGATLAFTLLAAD